MAKIRAGILGRHTLEDGTAADETACYLLSDIDDSRGRMFYLCSKPPEDNDNLICEQQGDGMDWICEATRLMEYDA